MLVTSDLQVGIPSATLLARTDEVIESAGIAAVHEFRSGPEQRRTTMSALMSAIDGEAEMLQTGLIRRE